MDRAYRSGIVKGHPKIYDWCLGLCCTRQRAEIDMSNMTSGMANGFSPEIN